MNMLGKALEYAKYVPVFPLAANTKFPLKGSRGYLDATQDIEQIKEWWTNNPQYNVSIVPSEAGMFVLDVDTPGGVGSLEDVGIWQRLTKEKGFQGCRTKSGGIHLYFKTDSKVIMDKTQVDLWEDVDILSVKHAAIAPPSVVDGKPYKGTLELDKVPQAPEWLVSAIEEQIKNKGKSVTNYSNSNKIHGKSYTGNLLDRIVTGVSKGERNHWLTSIAGSLFNSGMKPSNILLFLVTINENYVHEPLPLREVERIFKSIATRDLGRSE